MSTPESYQQPEQKSSVKISCTAKGEATPEIKVVEGTTSDELERIRVLAVSAYLQTQREVRGAQS